MRFRHIILIGLAAALFDAFAPRVEHPPAWLASANADAR